jgi:hypothetical protein
VRGERVGVSGRESVSERRKRVCERRESVSEWEREGE